MCSRLPGNEKLQSNGNIEVLAQVISKFVCRHTYSAAAPVFQKELTDQPLAAAHSDNEPGDLV